MARQRLSIPRVPHQRSPQGDDSDIRGPHHCGLAPCTSSHLRRRGRCVPREQHCTCPRFSRCGAGNVTPGTNGGQDASRPWRGEQVVKTLYVNSSVFIGLLMVVDRHPPCCTTVFTYCYFSLSFTKRSERGPCSRHVPPMFVITMSLTAACTGTLGYYTSRSHTYIHLVGTTACVALSIQLRSLQRSVSVGANVTCHARS